MANISGLVLDRRRKKKKHLALQGYSGCEARVSQAVSNNADCCGVKNGDNALLCRSRAGAKKQEDGGYNSFCVEGLGVTVSQQ